MHNTERGSVCKLQCGARGKRRGFSPGAAARHSQSARVYSKSFFFFRHIRGALLCGPDLRPDIAQSDSDLTLCASLSIQVGVTKMEECPEGILFASTETKAYTFIYAGIKYRNCARQLTFI